MIEREFHFIGGPLENKPRRLDAGVREVIVPALSPEGDFEEGLYVRAGDHFVWLGVRGHMLWLGRASALGLKPATPKAKRLAREAMASFWSKPGSPPVSLHDVVALGASVPELHITYLYSN